MVIGGRIGSPLGEAPSSSVNYCGGFPTKYPELLRADSSLHLDYSTLRHTHLTLKTENPRQLLYPAIDLNVSLLG